MKKNQAFVLLAVAGILFLQFYLRAHHPLHLPFFVDEHRHIARAEAAFADHPARDSMGKFLLYIWLAPFQGNKFTALMVSRLAIAMWSLLGSAALFALTRRLFGLQPALYAVLFYALAPLSLFYERMVLADGFAGVFGVLVAWQSVRLAEKPTHGRSVGVGLLVALAIMAKLTLTFAALLPVFAVYLLGYHATTPGLSMLRNARLRTRRYFPYLLTVGLTCIVAWLPVLIPAAIVATRGEYYILIDQSLADTNILNESDVSRYGYLWEQVSLMLSEPMVIVLLAAMLVLLWKAPRRAWYGILWLAALWFPAVFLVWRTRTRYLAPGTFALAFLLAGGLYVLQQMVQPHSFEKRSHWLSSLVPNTLLALVIGVWALSFALPFAHDAMTNATSLEVPVFDENDYFRGIQSAYRLEDILAEIGASSSVEKPMPVKGMFWMCTRFNIYFEFPSLDLDCSNNRYPDRQDIESWQDVSSAMQTYADENEVFFLVVEDYRDVPFDLKDRIMIPFAEYQRPKNGVWLTVWYVCQPDDIGCAVR